MRHLALHRGGGDDALAALGHQPRQGPGLGAQPLRIGRVLDTAASVGESDWGCALERGTDGAKHAAMRLASTLPQAAASRRKPPPNA